MTWLALADKETQRFSLRGLGVDRHESPVFEDAPGTVIPSGTLLVEAAVTGDNRPEILIGFDRPGPPFARSLWLKSIPGGGVNLIATLGGQIRHAAIQHGGEGRMDVLRISYSWDTTRGWARLAVERPGGTRVFSTQIDDPLPLLLSDFHSLIMDHTNASPNLVFAALSSKIEPLGPSPSLAADLPLMTSDGFKPAISLKRGDTVLTEDHGSVPVLFALHRRVPARGSFRPVRLRAPYFGLKKDVVVAPTQRLILSGSEVEYTYGRESVLVPVQHLVNGIAARFEPCGPVAEYSQLLMPAHEALKTEGCTLESLYIGRIRRRSPALCASILADLPRASLPEHAKPLHPVLGAFEARILAEHRAA